MTIPAAPHADDLRNLFSDALDEIYALRVASAVEGVLILDHLEFKTFPRSRRRFGERQVERLFQAANGHVYRAIAGTSSMSLDSALREAGGRPLHFLGDWIETKQPTTMPLAHRELADGEEAQLRENLERAFREIHETRRAIAYEAEVLLVHTHHTSFPKKALKLIEVQAPRMQAAARGEAAAAYRDQNKMSAMAKAEADPCMTNSSWLDEQPR